MTSIVNIKLQLLSINIEFIYFLWLDFVTSEQETEMTGAAVETGL